MWDNVLCKICAKNCDLVLDFPGISYQHYTCKLFSKPPLWSQSQVDFSWLILTGQIEANWLWSFLEARPKVSPTLCIYSGYRNELLAIKSFLFESTLFTKHVQFHAFESEILHLKIRVSKKFRHSNLSHFENEVEFQGFTLKTPLENFKCLT